MARLVPNPLGDIMQPLGRVESAINALNDELQDIHTLPRIEQHLADMSEGIATTNELLREIRDELQAGARPSRAA